LDWTQAELAQRVGYSVATIRKLERDELRPSKHLAELLAHGLDVALTHHSSFVSFARSTPMLHVQPDAQPIHAQRRSNLPAQLTPFFGRTAEIVELTQHLTNPIARLITVVGPGGMGKTRLALVVAQSMLDLHIQTDSTGNQKSSIKHQTYEDGVYFVALAPLRSPEHIVSAIAEAIDLRFQAGSRLPKQQLLDYLRHKQLLLVLDNFEHLQAGAELVLELLQACPGLRMLVTSREQLQLNSETLFVLESMALPSAVTLPDVLSYSAVQLFVETARRVRPKFTLTSTNAQAIVRICQLVGGMPLGIILAAAWVEVLSSNEIVTELRQGFDFLESELRDLPERQRSMRAVLTQSWQRLTNAERTVFMCLAVFRGGFTRMAAQHVAGASVRMLSSFVNKSLLQCEPNRRYTIHEFLRQFAEAELAAAKQTADAIRRTHAQYYLALAERSEPELHGSQQRLWLERLEAEHNNLRAALGWLLESGEVAVRLQLASALWRFWEVRGYLSEGRGWLELVLASTTQRTLVWAQVLYGAGILAWYQSDYIRAIELCEQSLAVCRELGDKAGIVCALERIGLVASDQGQHARAITSFEETLTLFRDLDDKHGIATSLRYMGDVLRAKGDYERAQALLEDSLVLSRELKDTLGTANSLSSLGEVLRIQGDYEHAQTLSEESLVLSRELGDKHGIATSLRRLGDVAGFRGDYERAQTHFDESLLLFRELGDKYCSAAAMSAFSRIAYNRGDCERAASLCEESIGVFHELGVRRDIISSLLSTLGNIALSRGDYPRAQGLFNQSLGLACEEGDKETIGRGLTGLAGLARVIGNLEQAARLWGSEHALRKIVDIPISGAERAEYESAVAAARTQLDAATFAAAWAEGQTMTLDDAVAYALVNPKATTDGSPVVSMNITDVTGVSPAQTVTLKAVGENV
jgi:predicted ATPase/DNA-binding XRE family transcriptional regulator